MFGDNGNAILLTGKASAPLTSDEIETIQNFLKTESGISEKWIKADRHACNRATFVVK